MRPLRWARIDGSAARMTRAEPKKLTSKWLCASSSAVASNGPARPTPAELTTTPLAPPHFFDRAANGVGISHVELQMCPVFRQDVTATTAVHAYSICSQQVANCSSDAGRGAGDQRDFRRLFHLLTFSGSSEALYENKQPRNNTTTWASVAAAQGLEVTFVITEHAHGEDRMSTIITLRPAGWLRRA
jgi:hypothetical protein